MESARVRDFHTTWWSIWNRTSEISHVNQLVWKPRTKRFPWCNLFILLLYILRFSHPQKFILALDKFELRTTRVHRKYYLVKAAWQSYPRWPRNTIRLNRGLWLEETIFSRVRNSLRLYESETLFHTAKFDAKTSVYIKQTADSAFCCCVTQRYLMSRKIRERATQPYLIIIDLFLRVSVTGDVAIIISNGPLNLHYPVTYILHVFIQLLVFLERREQVVFDTQSNAHELLPATIEFIQVFPQFLGKGWCRLTDHVRPSLVQRIQLALKLGDISLKGLENHCFAHYKTSSGKMKIIRTGGGRGEHSLWLCIPAAWNDSISTDPIPHFDQMIEPCKTQTNLCMLCKPVNSIETRELGDQFFRKGWKVVSKTGDTIPWVMN